MGMDADKIIQILTTATLAGLLISSGLALTGGDILQALRQCRITLVLLVNFVAVPAVAFALAALLRLSPDQTTAMALLAAAPFAPVVPTFTRLARANAALAAALTGTVPLLSAFLTPLICKAGLTYFWKTAPFQFDAPKALFVLFATITVPLFAGILVRHRSIVIAGRLLKPIQVIAEATGTLSLIAAIISQRDQLLAAVGGPLLAMFILFEISFLLGLAVGGPARAARFVIATGTGNRNIALALLISVQSFPASRITAYVVADGLALIFLGLIHVGLWRLFVRNQPPAASTAN
jgi:BASS family bile acid:Na+ symporter